MYQPCFAVYITLAIPRYRHGMCPSPIRRQELHVPPLRRIRAILVARNQEGNPNGWPLCLPRHGPAHRELPSLLRSNGLVCGRWSAVRALPVMHQCRSVATRGDARRCQARLRRIKRDCQCIASRSGCFTSPRTSEVVCSPWGHRRQPQ